MTERSLNDEIRETAIRVAAIKEEYVADVGSCIARIYRREREVILSIIGIDAMVSGMEREQDEEYSRGKIANFLMAGLKTIAVAKREGVNQMRIVQLQKDLAEPCPPLNDGDA